MGLDHKDIRKVLDIFHGIYLKANWSLERFPTWVKSPDQAPHSNCTFTELGYSPVTTNYINTIVPLQKAT